MDDQTITTITRSLLNDKTAQPILIRTMEMMRIVAALHLAAKHPAIARHTKKVLKLISRAFERGILALHPDAKDYLPNHAVSHPPDKATSERVFGDETITAVYITIRECWLLLGALQLITRHPDVPLDMVITIQAMGAQFQVAIAELHPDALELAAMGWNPAFDR